MIFQTPIMALLLVAGLAALTALWAGGFAVTVLRRWDLTDMGARQLRMERMTELVSTLFAAVMLAELAALLLFVFNADRMSSLFVGAMCAVGTLNVNDYGFPALYLKIGVFFAAVIWLILDRADRLGRDYPLTRVKYALLLAITPLILADGAVELSYFLDMQTDVITSCCSKLFTPNNPNLANQMAGVGEAQALWLLGLTALIALMAGVAALIRKRGYGLYALASALMFGMGLTAIVATISLYIYENPNHHCPFCILKPEYGYVGYALYVPLFLATAAGLGAGALSPFQKRASLAGPLPGLMRRLLIWSMAGFASFGIVCLIVIWRSHLILFG
ncbi:hypothetical protein BMI86_00805 [Thioclava sp. DLFJ5-1]|uniref:hypothetical protein n=1 Tax=Thioclava sp. DLFJ5-1 TaxID=1915314 RepID=UPI0009967B60|nr:hypothetical protein [Thioclava sp. DLFJ5-1]OOY21156.1 hypothetical protein BMI86_00805 [Thioclava sp. DLFJ5-1]